MDLTSITTADHEPRRHAVLATDTNRNDIAVESGPDIAAIVQKRKLEVLDDGSEAGFSPIDQSTY